MNEATARSPDWDHLFEIAASQDGLFTTQQAAEAERRWFGPVPATAPLRTLEAEAPGCTLYGQDGV
ncbi:MAG: hypothetical protein ACNA8W_15945 [Bradymonadaceae bacterium]